MVQIQPSPSTPLGLKFGVLYAPRVPAPPFVAFDAIEFKPDTFVIRGYDSGGTATEVFRGLLADTFHRFAVHLRMDVAP